jgi:hypothetical protein
VIVVIVYKAFDSQADAAIVEYARGTVECMIQAGLETSFTLIIAVVNRSTFVGVESALPVLMGLAIDKTSPDFLVVPFPASQRYDRPTLFITSVCLQLPVMTISRDSF